MENIYRTNECVVFRQTREAFGGLSNMATAWEKEIDRLVYELFGLNDNE